MILSIELPILVPTVKQKPKFREVKKVTEIQTTLIEFIRTTSGTETEIALDTDLLTTNILDSLMLMELVLLIENKWNVQLQGNDIAPSRFRTIDNLARLIGERVDSCSVENSESCVA